MQDNTEPKRLYHLSDDGQQFIFEKDKMYKIRENFILPNGETAHLVNEVVSILDIEDRPPYETKVIIDRRLYYETCIKPNVILKEWYQKIIGLVNEFINEGETILDKKFISDKILDQYLDTEYYIFAHIQDNDWYESITDFIWYNIESFGMVKGQASGFGVGVYIGLIEHVVQYSPIELDSKNKLLNYLTPFNDKTLKSEKSCKDLIIESYNKWFNLFPFELSHFADIRNKYQNNLPLLYRIPPRVNRFTNQLTATLYTQKDIISFLINETDKLHREFNGTILFEKGLLTDANRNLIEIANKTRLLKLDELNEKTSFESTVLEKINHWLKCEKEYINDIKDLIVNSPKTTNTKPQEPPKGYDLGLSVPQLETLHSLLIDNKFLIRCEFKHLKNAFNGEVLADDFKPLKWRKQYYASIVIRHCVEHDTPWQIALKVFDNGTSDSLKNAYDPKSLVLSDNQKNAKVLLDKIFKSLP